MIAVLPRLRHAAAAAAAVGALALAGCSESDAIDSAEDATETLMGHIHGLGTDPETGELYAAGHHGVFTFAAGTPRRVADRWQDTMAFTVIGPRHLLASGHPDLREDGTIHLGLIESTDAAETWQSLALAGEADFHPLDATDQRIYGYDAVTMSLLTSPGGHTWETVAKPTDAVDLAVDPNDSDRVMLTRPDATVHRHQRSGGNTAIRAAPPLLSLDWADLDTLVGLGPDATVYTSTAGARTGSAPAPCPASPRPWLPPKRPGMPAPAPASTAPPTPVRAGNCSPPADPARLVKKHQN